ncbi:MAG TPA: amidohydrolase [Chthoniobacteraceae bacterium]|nr:amidohydrolase [Chthoniobacteraceae bacterium]
MSHTARIAEIIEAKKERLLEASNRIWELAELRFEERRSAEVLIAVLEEEGFSVERGVAGLETAFIGSSGEGGPILAFLGEYDALPLLSQRLGVAREEPIEAGGNGHGCGHNLLGTGALAAAIATRDYLKENNLPGTVRYYGCPAEESGGGKVIMVAAGLFKDVDLALTWHPSDAHYVFSAPTLATQAVFFNFTGRSAHAAKNPHDGRSALDAVELTNVAANYLREHIPTDARLHYAITNTGGHAPNVVQAKASVRYQIRSPRAAQVAEVYRRLCNIARGAALMTETEVEIDEGVRYLDVVPNTTLEGVMQKNLEALGLPHYDEAERQFAREIRATLPGEISHRIPETKGREVADQLPPYRPKMSIHLASTDVGDVSWVVPTAQYRSATWAIGTQPHTWQAVTQGATSFANKGMLHAGKVLAATAVELARCPEVIEKAKAELKAAVEE